VTGDKYKALLKYIEFLEAEISRKNQQLLDADNSLVKMYRAYENLRLAEQRAKINPPDGLTGLPGKKEFIKRVAWHFKENDIEFTCAIVEFDVSNFKMINNHIGHDMGDKVITRVVKILKTITRAKPRQKGKAHYPDIIARLGKGDEFGACIILDEQGNENYESNEEILFGIVERHCLEFEKVQWAEEYQEWAKAFAEKPEVVALIKPTLNPGVVIVHAGMTPRVVRSARPTVEQILVWADQLMYESKIYERAHGQRQIFYKTVAFQERQIVKVSQTCVHAGDTPSLY